jgi:hypothetical protein
MRAIIIASALALAATTPALGQSRCMTSFGLTTCSDGGSYYDFDAAQRRSERQWREQQDRFNEGARWQQQQLQQQFQSFQQQSCPNGYARNGGRCL